MKNNLIGISGKIGSGKDTVGKILQAFTTEKNMDGVVGELGNDMLKNTSIIKSVLNGNLWYGINTYQIKKFADKLKDIVCLLIGCTREQLEDREFKEKELGKEWWYYEFKGVLQPYNQKIETLNFPYELASLIKPTPRKLLQLLGTECGREIIHPNIWVNALFADYKDIVKNVKSFKEEPNSTKAYEMEKPNWIITDVRFPNEAQAIKDRGGIVIRVNRKITSEEWQKLYPEVIVLDPDGWNRDERYQYEWFEEKITLEEYKSRVMRSTCKFKVKFEDYFKEHPSETALDKYDDFDYVIDNDGSIEELVEKIKQLKLL